MYGLSVVYKHFAFFFFFLGDKDLVFEFRVKNTLKLFLNNGVSYPWLA